MNEKNDVNNGNVIYQRDEVNAVEAPIFKPGTTPHTQFGKETLNANIAWHNIVEEIIAGQYSAEKLATEVGVSVKNVQNFLQKNYSDLSFRIGARILGIHSRLFPETYA